MKENLNTIIGALIAALVLFMSNITTLFMENPRLDVCSNQTVGVGIYLWRCFCRLPERLSSNLHTKIGQQSN